MPKASRAKPSSRWLLGASILALFSGGQAQTVEAQAPAEPTVTEETVIITATRRDSTVQDAPINIAAVTASQLEDQNLSDLAAAAAWVPSVHLVDQGGRTADRIVVRGLNVDTLGQTDVIGNNAGGSVATYVGETPMYLDLKLNDIDRVEFLLGPQGTLYGQGTLSGAIRYIPTKPKFAVNSFDFRAESYAYSQAETLSYDRGITFNLGMNNFAIRGSVDKLEDSGFIDYNYVVREPGAVNANIIVPGTTSVNGGDPYDLTPVKDANSEDTWSGRVALRWEPFSWWDTTFTHYFQHNHSGGRTVTNKSFQLPEREDAYVAPQRVLEPNSRDNKLYAWENEIDLGFAALTSSTSFAKFKERGRRDQTVLLTTLEYSYEAFPFFTAVTREEQEDDTFTQELRLVSNNDGPLNWIAGAYYSDFKSEGFSAEYTPGFSQWNLDNGAPGELRTDALEYFAPGTQDLVELAAYGELSYDVTPKWQVTGGLRWYKYKLKTADATDLPLYRTTIADPLVVDSGWYPDGSLELVYTNDGQRDDGVLFKFNTSYDFTDDFLGYFTVSEGYRIGGGNGVVPCTVIPPPAQPFAACRTSCPTRRTRRSTMKSARTRNGSTRR